MEIIFSSESPDLVVSSQGQEILVKVTKRGRDWARKDGQPQGSARCHGSKVHLMNAVVSVGLIDKKSGWSPALCGEQPQGDGGWGLRSDKTIVTCRKCLRLDLTGGKRFE